MLAVSQVLNHLRHGRRAQGQCQPLIGRPEVDHQRDLRTLNVLEENEGEFVLSFELLDDRAGFITRIDLAIDDDHILRPLLQ
jgi:hypothetical protein